MPMTQTEIHERIDLLERALASGELKVKFEDEEIEYRSVTEIRTSISYFQNKLTAKAKNNGVNNRFRKIIVHRD